MKCDVKVAESNPDALLAVACTFCSKSIGQRVGRKRVATPTSPPQPSTPQSPLASPQTHTTSTTAGTTGSTSGSVVKSKTSTSEGDIETCNCRKPRARCALCLSRLNTAASLALFKTNGRLHNNKFSTYLSPDCTLTSKQLEASSKMTKDGQPRASPRFPFSSFTVFCATCRHSGHALHYLEWFEGNANCPVAGCTCSCYNL